MAEGKKQNRGPRRMQGCEKKTGGSPKTLKELRINLRMKQSDLAALLGVSKYTVSGWERGIRIPSWEKLTALAKILNVSITEMLRILGIEEHADEMNIADTDQSPRCRNRCLIEKEQAGVVLEVLRLFALLDEQGRETVRTAVELSKKGADGHDYAEGTQCKTLW